MVLDGWMDGWVDGSQTRFKDCLQQSKIICLKYFGLATIKIQHNEEIVSMINVIMPHENQ